MKVRSKFGGHEYEVVEALVVRDAQGILRTVDRAAFEEVPTEQWQDITDACGFQTVTSLDETLYFQHLPGTVACNTLFEWPRLATIEGYRLRPVSVVIVPAGGMIELNTKLDTRIAFIVEKKC